MTPSQQLGYTTIALLISALVLGTIYRLIPFSSRWSVPVLILAAICAGTGGAALLAWIWTS